MGISPYKVYCIPSLNHWGRVTHIGAGELTTVGSYNELSPGRRQAIILTNGGILLIKCLATNFCEILIGIQTLPFKKIHLKISAKWPTFCLELEVFALHAVFICVHVFVAWLLRTSFILWLAWVIVFTARVTSSSYFLIKWPLALYHTT